MNSFKRILTYSTRYKFRYFLNILFNALYSCLSVISIVSIIPILSLLLHTPIKKSLNTSILSSLNLSKIFTNNTIIKFSYVNKNLNTLIIFCVLIMFLFFLRNIFRYFADYQMVIIRAFVIRDIRNDFHDKILNLPISFISSYQKGDLISRISNDVNELENAIVASLSDLISIPIMLIIHLIALLIMNYKLTLFICIILPIIGSIISIIGNYLKKDAKKSQSELGKLFSIIEENLTTIKIIKIFNAEKQRQNYFMKVAEQQKKWMTRANQKKELASPMSEFLGSFIIILIIWYGSKLIIEEKKMSTEIFISFIGLFFQLINPIKNLANSLSNLQKGKASASRIIEIIDAKNPIIGIHINKSINTLKKSIIFKNVSFSYEKTHPILKNFNMKILKGQNIAIIGSSGSGKSTIINLLVRFYDIQEGEILIDGNNIRNIEIKNYQQLFGIVTQDPIFFNDTIFNNIALGIKNPSWKNIIKAAKSANAHDFIKKLPNGYNTFIGDCGNKLSGGQKQKLSIARVVMKNPPIIILDEATSSLDIKSEKIIQNFFNKITEKCTLLTITHKLSTIQNSDHIIVLEKGKITEQGTHKKLMHKNGLYHNLLYL